MRFDVQPIGRNVIPASSMFSVQISTITMTRFCYGVEVDLRNFDSDAGNVLVLTTLQGSTRHAAGTRDETELTVVGLSSPTVAGWIIGSARRPTTCS